MKNKIYISIGMMALIFDVLLFYGISQPNSNLNQGAVDNIIFSTAFVLTFGFLMYLVWAILAASWAGYRAVFPSKETKRLVEEHEGKMRDDPEYRRKIEEIEIEEKIKALQFQQERFEKEEESERAANAFLFYAICAIAGAVILAAVLKWSFLYVF